MALIQKLTQNSGYYYETALESMRLKNYERAAKYLQNAIKIEKREEYLSTLAACYFHLSSYHASTNIFCELMRTKPNLDYLAAIAKNKLTLQKNVDAAEFFYLTAKDMYRSLSAREINLDEDDFFIDDTLHELLDNKLDELHEAGFSNDFFHINTKQLKQSRALFLAIDEFRRENYDKAVLHASEVTSDSEHYIEALDIITTASFVGADFALAKKSAVELRGLDSASISAFKVLYELGLNEQPDFNSDAFCNDYCNVLLGEGVGVAHLYDAQNAFLFFNKFTFAFKIARRIYHMLGNSENSLINYALSAFATGNLSEGETCLAGAIRLYPNDARVKLLIWIKEKGAKLDDWRVVLCGRAVAHAPSILKDLKHEVFTLGKKSPHISEKAANLTDILLFLDDERCFNLLDRIMQSKSGMKRFLATKLYDEILPEGLRFEILKQLVINGVKTTAVIATDNKFIRKKIKSLNLQKDIFNYVFAEVVAIVLRTEDSVSVQKLEKIVKEMARVNTNLNRYNILCAAAHCRFVANSKQPVGENKQVIKEVCEIYETTAASLKKYLAVFFV
jgi:tetratricopeptide (TPR) repeat protein